MVCVIRHPSCGSGAASVDFCRTQPVQIPRGSTPWAAGAGLRAGLNAGPPPSPHREATPCPCPLAGAGDLSELGWSVDLPKPSAPVSSKACPRIDMPYAHACTSIAMAVRVPLKMSAYVQEVPSSLPPSQVCVICATWPALNLRGRSLVSAKSVSDFLEL